MDAWKLIKDYTVPSDTSSFTVTSFGTITKDDFIKVVGTFNSTSAGSIDVQLVGNSSVTSNYHNQFLIADGSGVSAARSNASFVQLGRQSQDGLTTGYLKLSENDRLNMFFNDTRVITDGNQVQVNFSYSTSSGATFPNGITSLTFTANRNMEAGTRIQIYKLAAEKVADITVGSNTTQVDIPNLNITKDSEYLLVSDAVQNGASFSDLRLMINDNITDTNYYSQRILGSATTTNAARSNNAKMAEMGSSGVNALIYSHIKLSNIGAYTSQNYQIQGVGSTGPNTQNWFVSSTAENITSITKLNVRSNVTNAIAAGARFILYKLYEPPVPVFTNTYELLYEETVTSAKTQIDITGLNITKDDEVRLVWTTLPATGNINVFANDNTTLSNYTGQYLYAGGTTASPGRLNQSPIVTSMSSNRKSAGFADIKVSNNDKFVMQSQWIFFIGTQSSGVEQYNYNIVGSGFTLTSINKLSIVASATNGIAVGSKIKLFKVN